MSKTFKPKTTGVTVDENENLDFIPTVETEEETVEEEVDTENTEGGVNDIIINADIEQKPAVKSFKILPKVDHNCYIGGTRYYLRKGVQTNVPQEVKDILNKAGLLMPL